MSELPPPSKPPVRRRLDFTHVYDIETEIIGDDELIPCGQRSPLVKMEVAMQPGYLHDNWFTSRVADIKWLSELETVNCSLTATKI